MTIRMAMEYDIYKVSRLWLEMVKELDDTLTPNVNKWRHQALIFMKNKLYYLFVMERGGSIIGFIDFFIFDEPATDKRHCVGQHFFVKKNKRGFLGGKLYNTAIKYAKELGAEKFELMCFEKELNFWKRHGYELKRCLVRK